MFNGNVTDAAPQIFSAWLNACRPRTSIAEFVRIGFRVFAAWRRRRREHRELLEYLASDYRAAADIGYRHRQN
jgi:uncharacterized protein YjiS (DUF1127 family)